jgi:hypothetical protein
MPNLEFDFTWYKDTKGYRLVSAPRMPKRRSMREILETRIDDIQPARIVRNGGRLVPYQPLKIDNLFARFTEIKSEADVLAFVEKFGPLTADGLELLAVGRGRSGYRQNGDVVPVIIDHARSMLGTARMLLSPLSVMIVTDRNETRLQVSPACLLDAIWLQYAQANTRSRQCRECGERFLVGSGGRRADAEFCSDKCRVKFNSLNRSRRR